MSLSLPLALALYLCECVCVLFVCFWIRRNSKKCVCLHSTSLLCGKISNKSLMGCLMLCMKLDNANSNSGTYWLEGTKKKHTAFTAVIAHKKACTHTFCLPFGYTQWISGIRMCLNPLFIARIKLSTAPLINGSRPIFHCLFFIFAFIFRCER